MSDTNNSTVGQVTVYTKPDCVQCDSTKRRLREREIPFVEIDLSENEEALDRLRGAGWMRAPVVETADGEMWSGFRPDRIRKLAAQGQVQKLSESRRDPSHTLGLGPADGLRSTTHRVNRNSGSLARD